MPVVELGPIEHILGHLGFLVLLDSWKIQAK